MFPQTNQLPCRACGVEVAPPGSSDCGCVEAAIAAHRVKTYHEMNELRRLGFSRRQVVILALSVFTFGVFVLRCAGVTS